MKRLLQISIVLIIIVGIVLFAFSYVATIAYADEGYPAPVDYGYPIDVGYPIGYPVDYGYPIYDPYPVIGYPVEIVSEPTKLQAEITEIIANVQPKEKSKTYQAWQQLKIIVKYYYGKVRLQWR